MQVFYHFILLGVLDIKKFIDEIYEVSLRLLCVRGQIAEFLYNYARVFGWEATLVKNSLIRSSSINVIGCDEGLTVYVARLKHKHYNTLSLADCYLITLAKIKKASILTTDKYVKEVNEVSTIHLPIERR